MLFLMLLQAAVAQPAIKPDAGKPDAAVRTHVEARDVTLGGSENTARKERYAKSAQPSEKSGSVDAHVVAGDAKTTEKPAQPKAKARPKG